MAVNCASFVCFFLAVFCRINRHRLKIKYHFNVHLSLNQCLCLKFFSADKEHSHSVVQEDHHVHEIKIPTEPYPITLRPLGSPKSPRKKESSIEEEGKSLG